jgi:hypothetical protein
MLTLRTQADQPVRPVPAAAPQPETAAQRPAPARRDRP